MSGFSILLPVFLTIVAGLGLRRTGLIGETHWVSIDRLCYYVLFPCFFFKEIALADFGAAPVLRIALAMALAIVIMSAALVMFHKPLNRTLGMDGPQFSSFFQGVTRWHTFIAFAVVPLALGQQAVALAALAAAVMTPILNLICVWVLSRFASARPPPLRDTGLAIARNPFLLSSLAGLLWHATGLGLQLQVGQTLDIIARGALGLALLSVGAGLRFEVMANSARAISAATALKLLAMPLLIAALLKLLGVTGEAAAVAILCNAVPTGSGAYVLARQMGGDAPLMATILTVQVIAAAVTLPLIIVLIG